MKDQEFIDKVLKMADKKRGSDPLQRQLDKLLEETYPYKKLVEFYYLGQASMLHIIKKELSKNFCKNDADYFDECLERFTELETVGKYLKELMKD